jgi:hypothetical protein
MWLLVFEEKDHENILGEREEIRSYIMRENCYRRIKPLKGRKWNPKQS